MTSSLFEDDLMAKVAAHHRRRRLLQGPVRRGEHDIAGQMVGHGLAVRVLPGTDRAARMSRSVMIPWLVAIQFDDHRRSDPSLDI